MYPLFSFWNGKRKQSSHLEIISFIYIYLYLQQKKPQKDEMRWKQNLALNNEMRMNEMKMKPCI